MIVKYTETHDNFNRLSPSEQEDLIKKVSKLYDADIDVDVIVAGLNKDPGLICETIDIIEERRR